MTREYEINGDLLAITALLCGLSVTMVNSLQWPFKGIVRMEGTEEQIRVFENAEKARKENR